MQDLRLSRTEESGNVETLATSELCSNSLPRRPPGNGKEECWPGDMRKIPAAKTGNMAIPFQSEVRNSRAPYGRLDRMNRTAKLDKSLASRFDCTQGRLRKREACLALRRMLSCVVRGAYIVWRIEYQAINEKARYID